MPQVIPRLSPFGRALIVERVAGGRPVAHVAAELGVSRQTAYRWVNRFREGGVEALFDRSSRPHSSPNRTTHDREVAVLAARAELRQGPLRLTAETGVPARTISRILARHGVPWLSWCDPVTGLSIRASRSTAHRYERERPGELVHVDVKKLGRIPDGGGWRVHGRAVPRDRVNGPGSPMPRSTPTSDPRPARASSDGRPTTSPTTASRGSSR